MDEQEQRALEWRIYYGDGTTFSSLDGETEDAPALNVQAIVQLDKQVGRHIVSRRDFYIYRDGEWYGVDWFGLLDHLMDLGIVKAGRTLSNEDYERIYMSAASDPGLPPKSAMHWLEVPPDNGRDPQ
jgi:hypothetical protein